ncbi:hypothetical protein ACJ2A9_05490 [Anaerobacillus sp. MEB173]|uniref:hypothetical protein n=1 Tax=Anaerobacillus sp. MEB173 TaxID=3383345 RepID=UPI003F917443
MKRALLFFLFLLLSYSTYYDLTIGTLPTKATTAMAVKLVEEEINSKEESYKEVKIKPGDTVLSIVEHIHDGPIKASINQIIYDFQLLNPDTNPEEISIGKTYKFPIYNK